MLAFTCHFIRMPPYRRNAFDGVLHKALLSKPYAEQRIDIERIPGHMVNYDRLLVQSCFVFIVFFFFIALATNHWH